MEAVGCCDDERRDGARFEVAADASRFLLLVDSFCEVLADGGEPTLGEVGRRGMAVFECGGHERGVQLHQAGHGAVGAGRLDHDLDRRRTFREEYTLVESRVARGVDGDQELVE